MSGFTLRMLAMSSMLLDHIGAAFEHSLPGAVYIVFRTAGRIAMPLFCFLIAEGLFHTRNARKYLLRLLMLALVSEVPFDRLFLGEWLEFGHQNVGFTLLLGLLGILLFDTFAARGQKAAALTAILAAGCAAWLLRSDYTVYGVYYIFIFYIFRGNKLARAVALTGGVLLLSFSHLDVSTKFSLVSLAAVLAVVPITLYNGERGLGGRAAQGVFYAFYPVHLLILYAVRLAVG
jgi:hypothetical protein